MASIWDDFDATTQKGKPVSAGGNMWEKFDAEQPGDTMRGFKTAWEQIPQLGYGLASITAGAIESAAGQGGLATAAKNWALSGYKDWGAKIQEGSRDTDEFDVAYGRAKEGDFGALVDWLQYGVGYAAGQAIQVLGTAGVGAAAGKLALRPAVEKLAAGMVEKNIAAGMTRAEAVSTVAGQAGALAATGAQAFGMEAGEIGGDLVQANEGKVLTGSQLARAAGGTILAGTFEFAGDALGLGALLGKVPVGKTIAGMGGVSGRVTRGLVGGAMVAPAEGLTEYMQTGAEEWGKGKESSVLPWQQSAEAQRQALNAGALGALGGAVMGAGGGLMTGPRAPQEQPIQNPEDFNRNLGDAKAVDAVDAAQSVEEAVALAAAEPVKNFASLLNEADGAGLVRSLMRQREFDAAQAQVDGPSLPTDVTTNLAIAQQQLQAADEPAPPTPAYTAPKRTAPAKTATALAFEKDTLAKMEALEAKKAQPGTLLPETGTNLPEAKSESNIYGIPVSEMRDPDLVHAAANHPHSAAREVASNELQRRHEAKTVEPVQTEDRGYPPVKINGQAPEDMTVAQLQHHSENAPFFDQKDAAAKELLFRDKVGQTADGKTIEQMSDKALDGLIANTGARRQLKMFAAAEKKRRGKVDADMVEQLKDPVVAEQMRGFAAEAGWAERGGKLIRVKTSERAGDEKLSRTKWIPVADWWPGRPVKESEVFYQEAVRAGLAGQPLTRKQKQAVHFMLGMVEDGRTGFEVDPGMTEVDAQTVHDDIELGSDPVPDSWAGLTEEQKEDELDKIFGADTRGQNAGQDAGAAQVGAQDAQSEVGAGGEKQAEEGGIDGRQPMGRGRGTLLGQRSGPADDGANSGRLSEGGSETRGVARSASAPQEDQRGETLNGNPRATPRDAGSTGQKHSPQNALGSGRADSVPGDGGSSNGFAQSTEDAAPEVASENQFDPTGWTESENTINQKSGEPRFRPGTRRFTKTEGGVTRTVVTHNGVVTKDDSTHPGYIVKNSYLEEVPLYIEVQANNITGRLVAMYTTEAGSKDRMPIKMSPRASQQFKDGVPIEKILETEFSDGQGELPDGSKAPHTTTVEREGSDRPALDLEAQTEADLKAKVAREKAQEDERARIKRESELGAGAFTLQPETKPQAVVEAENEAAQTSLLDQPAAPAFGDKNKTFTKDKADKARELLRRKLGSINTGLDPEVIQAGIELAGYYIEGGARSFADYSGKMVGDLGDAVKPYLKSWYAAIRHHPGFDAKGMDKLDEIPDHVEPTKLQKEVKKIKSLSNGKSKSVDATSISEGGDTKFRELGYAGGTHSILGGFGIGETVKRGNEVGVVRALIITDEKIPRNRALVEWPADGAEQYVDLDKLTIASSAESEAMTKTLQAEAAKAEPREAALAALESWMKSARDEGRTGVPAGVNAEGVNFNASAPAAKKGQVVVTMPRGTQHIFKESDALAMGSGLFEDGAPSKSKAVAVKEQLFVVFEGQKHEVASFEDAADKWDAFREESGIGSSDLEEDPIIVDQTGKQVARISYNGKVWPNAEYTPGSTPVAVPKSMAKPEKDVTPLQAEIAKAKEKSADRKAAKDAPIGASDSEVEEIGDLFIVAAQDQAEDDEQITHVFDAPAKGEIVRLADKTKVYNAQHGWMSVAEAKAKIDEWKAHAAKQGKTSANSDKVVLSLFDLTGQWSQPWEDAGYQVYRFDIQDDWFYDDEDPDTGEVTQKRAGDVNNFSHEFFADMFGHFDGADVHAILAACPCTDFAVSGARHFAAKDADGRTVESVKLVQMTQAVVEYFKPAVWAIENPVGRIEKLGDLPPWRLSFDPNHIGDPYTKKTLLWGRFNADLPIAPVEPTEGSKMHQKYGGKSQKTKNARSVTPEGFAYSFFMANNFIDHTAMSIHGKYDRLDKNLIRKAVEAGVTEAQIKEAVDDFYYMDLDDKAANDAIRDLTKEAAAAVPAATVSETTAAPVDLFNQPAPAPKAAEAAKALETPKQGSFTTVTTAKDLVGTLQSGYGETKGITEKGLNALNGFFAAQPWDVLIEPAKTLLEENIKEGVQRWNWSIDTTVKSESGTSGTIDGDVYLRNGNLRTFIKEVRFWDSEGDPVKGKTDDLILRTLAKFGFKPSDTALAGDMFKQAEEVKRGEDAAARQAAREKKDPEAWEVEMKQRLDTAAKEGLTGAAASIKQRMDAGRADHFRDEIGMAQFALDQARKAYQALGDSVTEDEIHKLSDEALLSAVIINAEFRAPQLIYADEMIGRGNKGTVNMKFRGELLKVANRWEKEGYFQTGIEQRRSVGMMQRQYSKELNSYSAKHELKRLNTKLEQDRGPKPAPKPVAKPVVQSTKPVEAMTAADHLRAAADKMEQKADPVASETEAAPKERAPDEGGWVSREVPPGHDGKATGTFIHTKGGNSIREKDVGNGKTLFDAYIKKPGLGPIVEVGTAWNLDEAKALFKDQPEAPKTGREAFDKAWDGLLPDWQQEVNDTIGREELEAKATTWAEGKREEIEAWLKTVSTKLRVAFRKFVMLLAGVAVALNVHNIQNAEAMPVPAGPKTVIVKTLIEKPKADFGGAKVSAKATLVANWIMAVKANDGKPFVVADKKSGVLYVMGADGGMIDTAPALYGEAADADEMTPEQLTKPMSAMTKADKITPAGRWTVSMKNTQEYGWALRFNDGNGLYLHSAYLGVPSEQRLERLASSSPSDNFVTWGCINVPQEFAKTTLVNTFKPGTDYGLFIIPVQDEKTEATFGILAKDMMPDVVEREVPAPGFATQDGRGEAPADRQRRGEYTIAKSAATREERQQAKAYEAANGILPYTSAGPLDIPVNLEGDPQFSIKAVKPGEDEVLGLPINKNGTVTLYYHTTNEEARRIGRDKTLRAQGDSTRIYLTNESSGWKVKDNLGSLETPSDGSVVLLQVPADLLQLDQVHPDGRRDFFIATSEGEYFHKKKAQQWALYAPRDKAIDPTATMKRIEDDANKAAEDWKKMTPQEKRIRLKQARATLKREHNVTTLLTVNGKLEKTNSGDYGLSYDGKSVDSMGLGMASAQKINDKLSTCPNAARCEGLCLGDTSGQNLLYGGAADEDAIGAGNKTTDFRAGPRLSQFLKTEAFVVHTADFVTVLSAEIESLERWDAKTNRPAKVNRKGEKTEYDQNGYQSAVRLNVTSDIPPKVFRALMEAHPDTMFYDYTKLKNSYAILPNHHLTYSSTGASQIVDGQLVVGKGSNWDEMVEKMMAGHNVAMAFTDKNEMPKWVKDEKTGKVFQVWNADNYDARFLDPKRKDGIGMIAGLTNKDRSNRSKNPAIKYDGFFIDYNPKRDGKMVTIRDQSKILPPEQKAVAMVFQKRVEANQLDSTQRDIERMDDEAGGPRFSREAVTDTAAFKKFFDGSKVVDRDGQPMVMAHGTGRLFSQFRMDSELGAHFGPAEQANAITGYASDNDSAYSGRTYPVYLSIKNPLRLEDHGNWGADDVGQQLFAKKIITQDQMLQLKPRWNESGQKINSELRALIRKAGYDGVVYLNRRESSGAKEGDGVTGSTRMSDKQFLAKYPAAQDSWIAFRPTQIKSATGNNGQFDGKNPDIRFSQDEPVGVESGNGPLRQDDQAKTDIGVIERSLARHFQIPGIPSGTFGPVRLPDDSALQRIAGAFGKRALGVRIDPSKLGDRPQVLVDDLTGWNGINIPGRQFVGLREGARRPHLALLGHELAHGLENDDPELYAELVEAIRPYIKQSEYQRMFTRDYPGMTAKGIRAEFIGEVFSDGFMNPKFWDSIGRNSPALLRKVIDAVRLLMERAAKALGYTNKTAKYLTDFDTVMGIAARAMARYEGNQRARAGDTSPQFSGKLAPTFYSELESKLSQVGMKAGPAKAWKDYIKSQIGKGVKADEIEAVGINEWLDLQQGKVTKEQVMSYLAQNGVKVDEVMLGKRTRIESDKERLENMSEDEFRTQVEETLGFDTSEMDLSLDSMDRDDLIESILRENRMAGESRGLVSDEPDTKFAQYALPGAKGGSYRELLLTLPRTPYDRAAATAETNRIAGEYEVRINNVVEAGNIGEYEGGRGAALREADRLRAEREAVLAPLRAQQPADSNFQSTHFDQPNILAHIRFNERTDADGKKVLFLEEVQSDWAQKGRKQGFALTAVEREEMMRLNERTRTTDEVSRLEALVKRDSGVPAAPFVQKTDAWTALVLKRMIRYAAENGFDSVAWTTGEQQVKRYESALRKRVDQIEWTKTPQGIHLVGYKGKKPALTNQQTERLAVLEARNQNTLTGHEIDEIVRMRGVYGYTKVVDTTQKEDALSDAIGKVMADRIIADPNQSGTIEGKNITIDKTGMAGYYGKIMPAVANGILKRLGGGKVGEVGITNGLDGVDPNTGEKLGRKGEMLQPGFQITPEMRDKVMAGQPLFSRAAKGMTAAFREWFGNSKVVDANGEPKVMYHGSTVHHDGNKRGFPLGVFKEFDRLATRKAFGRESLDQVGSWFSDNPSEDGGAGMYTPSDGVMYPVHLSISNPWVVGFKGLWRIAQNQSGQPVGDKPNAKSVDAIRAWLKNMGYDGIHIKREARDESTEFEKQDVWIALEREQIKSVFNPEAEGGPKFSRNKTMGVNVNQDGDNRYADKIVDGDKTMETRASDSLRPYVGQRVAIVRTGAGPAKAIGEVTIGEPIVVRSQREFAKYAEQHLVPKGSKFDLQPGQAKYLYPLTDAVRYPVEKGVGLGIVSRSVKFSRENVLPKNATVLLANKRLSEQPRDVIDALSAGFRDKTDGSMLWEDMFLNLVQEDVTGQELLEVMSNYEESAPRGSEDLRAAAALYAIGIDGMRGDGFETSFASGAVDLQFSREPGFFFDAKSSPLYKTRTAAQVGVMSTAQANEALQTDATARRILEKGITPQPGDVVGVRLNLNVLKKTGVPVMTIHKGSKGDGYKSNRGLWGGEAITYQPVVTVKDAYLNVHQAAREKIATGADSKSPMASVDGKFSTGHSFDGVEFRFNPKREHLFRDGLGRVLKRADEVTLYGNSVYARGEIEYYGPEDVPARAGDAATAGRLMDPENPDRGAPQFSRGESSSDGAGPSRSLPSQTDPFSPGAKTSEDSTPQFNRAPAIAGSQTTGSVTDSILANAVNFTRDLLHTDHKMGWWARSVGTQQHKALTNAEFAPVYEEGQAFIGDQSKFANESADLAPSLLPRIDGFGDFAKKSATEKEIERVTEATYAGTLFGSGSPLEGRKWTDAELRTGRAEDGQFSIPAFTPLNEREIELYHELMNATAHSLDTMGVSLIHKLAVQHDIGFDRDMALEDVAQVVRDQVEDEITDRSVELEEITDPKYIADMAGNAADEAGDDRAGERAAAKVRRDLEKRAKKLQAEIDELEALKTGVDDIEKKITGLKDHGYFPAQRFGQYAIQILDRNGRQLHFSMYETEREANKAERELRKEFPKDNFERMILPDQQYKMFMGMSMDTFEAFADKITGEDGSPISKDPLMQAFFKAAASERSVMKRHIHRKGTAGFNRDLPRVLANFVVSSARATSSNYHSAQMAKLAGRIRAGDVQDEANKLVKYLLEPKEEAQALRGFLFAQFLGGSIAHGIVNMSQPFLVTGPYLTQFTSVKDAAAKLGAAMTTKQKDLTGRLKDDYERAKKEGIVSPQEIHQLRAEASGMAMGRSLLARKFGFIWGSIYSITEQFNRSTSFIAAYRIAQEKGMRDPYAFAVETVNQTQFVYNKGNRPNAGRGALGATVMTFKQFSISYLELAKRLYDRKGPDGKADRKAFAMLLLMLLAAAGLEGLPFAEDIEDLIDTIGQWMGYGTNSKKKLRQWATAVLGPDMAQVALKGVSGLPFMPVDISVRMGMANLIPGTAMLKPSEKNKARDVLEILGPAGQLIPTDDTMVGKALDRLAHSDWYGAVKAGAPVAVQNLAKGAEMLDKGYATDFKGKKIVDVSAGEAVFKMAGLQPASVARESAKIGIIAQDIAIQRKTEADIAERWARGIVDGDPADVQAARQKLADWNKDNPELRIRIQMPQIARRVKEMRMPRDQRFIKSAPPELRPGVRDALR